MQKSYILEAQNTFSYQNRLRNMDTVTIKKYEKFSGFCPTKPPVGQNPFLAYSERSRHGAFNDVKST